MVQEKCVYNPERDLSKVDPSGWIDLAKANALSSVPQNISNVDLSFNGIEDPNSIGMRVHDAFEAAAAAKVIAGYKAPEHKNGE